MNNPVEPVQDNLLWFFPKGDIEADLRAYKEIDGKLRAHQDALQSVRRRIAATLARSVRFAIPPNVRVQMYHPDTFGELENLDDALLRVADVLCLSRVVEEDK